MLGDWSLAIICIYESRADLRYGSEETELSDIVTFFLIDNLDRALLFGTILLSLENLYKR